MRFLSRVLFVLFLVISVLIALSNAQPVKLTIWPLPIEAEMPLYLLMVGLLLVGVLAGLGLGWWAARHHRRRAREHGNEAARLDREVGRLREALATRAVPAASNGTTPDPQGQRALERQRALVAPELMPPARGSSAPPLA
jgi:uncharacterized integral membrane protein